MNERIKQLAEQASKEAFPLVSMAWMQLFAELIVRECLGIVKSNTHGPAGEYDYGYTDERAAADERAETIYNDIAYRFGVEE